MMHLNTRKQFELFVIRPVFLLLLGLAIIAGCTSHWWFSVVCAFAWAFVGAIGSSLHPLQTARDLSNGPMTNPVAALEDTLLPDSLSRFPVSISCTKVGMLLGAVGGCFAASFLNFRWYWAIAVGCYSAILIGGVLKWIFVLRPISNGLGGKPV
jgi:hypothetical protein